MSGEAMPTGREKPGEHWNARIIREEAERKTEIATATRLGFELGKAEGRKQAGEEIAAAIIERRDADDSTREFRAGLGAAATIAANLFSQPNGAASNGLTDTPTSPKTHGDAKARSIRIPGGEG